MFNPFSISGKFVRAVSVAAVFVLLAVALDDGNANAAGRWVVASTEGAVAVNGQAIESPGLAVGPGTVIETGDNGKVVLVRSDDSITVYPNSRMSVPMAADGAEPGVLQTLGKLMFRMESRESRDFKVTTPYLAAAIKGTTFTVSVDDDDAEVGVTEGSVLVTANRSGFSAYVGPGQRAIVGDGRGDSVRVSEVRSDVNRDDDERDDDERDNDERDDDERDDDERDDDKSDRSNESSSSPDGSDSSESEKDD